jgi:hypothetical protein
MRGRIYLCPRCQAQVFPRLGRRRDAHFAHWPGQGSPECELFHASDDIHHPSPSFGHDDTNEQDSRPAIPPLALSIELEPEILVRGSRLRQWGLRLTVPKSDDSHGSFKINCGGKDVRTVALSKLVLQSVTLSVDPDAADFAPQWISPEVRPRFRAALERVAGLDSVHINVFAATTQKYKPCAKSLAWGDSYYFVWQARAFPALPPMLIARRLAERGAWSCALVTLPDESDAELERWLQDSCARRITKKKQRWSILYPVPYDIDIAGQIVVAPSASVLVGMEGGDAGSSPKSGLECRVLDARASLSASMRGQRLFEIVTCGAHEKGTIRLSWGEGDLPEISRAAAQPPSALPAVVLRVRARSGGAGITARLHQPDGWQLLEKVRAQASDLIELSIPSGVRGLLKRRRPPNDWQVEVLAQTESAPTTETTYRIDAELLVSVNRALQDSSSDISLDFSAFGSFYAGANRPEYREVPVQRLNSELRRKIVWLCKTAGPSSNQARHIDQLDDAALLRLLSRVRVPESLIAQQRFITSALRRSGRELPA